MTDHLQARPWRKKHAPKNVNKNFNKPPHNAAISKIYGLMMYDDASQASIREFMNSYNSYLNDGGLGYTERVIANGLTRSQFAESED